MEKHEKLKKLELAYFRYSKNNDIIEEKEDFLKKVVDYKIKKIDMQISLFLLLIPISYVFLLNQFIPINLIESLFMFNQEALKYLNDVIEIQLFMSLFIFVFIYFLIKIKNKIVNKIDKNHDNLNVETVVGVGVIGPLLLLFSVVDRTNSDHEAVALLYILFMLMIPCVVLSFKLYNFPYTSKKNKSLYNNSNSKDLEIKKEKLNKIIEKNKRMEDVIKTRKKEILKNPNLMKEVIKEYMKEKKQNEKIEESYLAPLLTELKNKQRAIEKQKTMEEDLENTYNMVFNESINTKSMIYND